MAGRRRHGIRSPISLSCDQALEDRLRNLAAAEGNRPIAHVIRRLVWKGLALESALGKEPFDHSETVETQTRAALQTLQVSHRQLKGLSE